MEKLFDINEEGFSVRCKLFFNKDIHAVNNVVIATHGFGGFKDNNSIARFAEKIISKYKNYGVICFDWPCHGMDARKKLRLEECMTYMRLVVSYAKEKLNAENVYNYSTSFGGYLTLKYVAENENPFAKIALRCPAIKMYDVMDSHMSEEDRVKLSKNKDVISGYERKIVIDKAFMDELKECDITKKDYMDYADSMLIIHGTKDEMVPISYSEEFSDNNVIELIKVEGADHRFFDQKKLDFAIQKIIEFFAPKEA